MVSEHPNFETEFGFDVINLDFILVPFPGSGISPGRNLGSDSEVVACPVDEANGFRPIRDVFEAAEMELMTRR